MPLDIVIFAHASSCRAADYKVLFVSGHPFLKPCVGIKQFAVQVQTDFVPVESEGDVIVFVRLNFGLPVDQALFFCFALETNQQGAVRRDVRSQMTTVTQAGMIFRDQRLVLAVTRIVGIKAERPCAFCSCLRSLVDNFDRLICTAECSSRIIQKNVRSFKTLRQGAGQIDLTIVVPLVGRIIPRAGTDRITIYISGIVTKVLGHPISVGVDPLGVAVRCNSLLNVMNGINDAIVCTGVSFDVFFFDAITMNNDVAQIVLVVGAASVALLRINGDH